MSKFAAWVWILSAGIAALVFSLAPMSVIVWCIICSAALQTSHQVSPVALAWSKSGFRSLMLRQWKRYLLLPVGVFALAVALPFDWVSPIYWSWNSYHYGMQNFGVIMMAVRPRRRWLAMAGCLLLTTGPMLFLAFSPHHQMAWLFVFGAAMQFNHWIVDVGLSGRISRHGWLFVVGILLVGLIGFVWYEPTAHGFHRRSDNLLQIAMALGFVHFLYSGGLPGLRMGVWHLSDPQVRKAILV